MLLYTPDVSWIELIIVPRRVSMRRKFISPCLFTLLLIPLTFLSGCGDDSTSPSGGGFYFKLTVVDQGGAPVSGLNISRRCRIEYDGLTSARNQAVSQQTAGAGSGTAALLQPGIVSTYAVESGPGAYPFDGYTLNPSRPNPGTDGVWIQLDTDPAAACDLEISILDWKNEEVLHHSTSLPEGIINFSISYPFIDMGSNYLPNGIFHSVFTVTEPGTPTVLFKDSVYFSGHTDRDPFRQSIGHTNDNGWFSTHDKGYFPSLQGHQPQMGYDHYGAEQGLFSFSDTIDVKVMTELPPLTAGVVYWMTRELVITGDRNEFEWVFVPDDSILVE